MTMPIQKPFLIKVYAQDGTTLRTNLTTDRPEGTGMHVKNDVNFTDRINSGQGQLILDIKTPFDSFGEGTTIDFMNIVKVYSVVVDDSTATPTQTSTLIYTGFMSRYEPYIEAGTEGVRVTCLGLGSLLTRSYFSDGDFTVPRGAEDPTITAKAIIDAFNAVFGGSLLSYDASSVPATVGTSITYTFTDQKWFEALKKTVELAGTGWWWSIRADGKLYLKAKPSSATHTFTIGKDIASLSCTKDSEQVVNDVYVRRTGATETHYTDATSQTNFGTGSPATGLCTGIITDESIQNSTTADQRGNKEIADKKDEKLAARLVIRRPYNLETINVGDTCKVQNFSGTSSFFGSNMQIVSRTYAGDTMTLELEQLTSDFGTALNSFVNG